MNDLAATLGRLIAAQGPISLAAFMALCTQHRAGYYAAADPIGARGDFTTAPEISQIFGELVGAALAQSWLDLDRPSPALLVEAGPGRGTAMADILRATSRVDGFAAAREVHLIETSPVLRAVQQRAIAGYRGIWHASLEALPRDAPILLVANEFLDALPIRQLVRTAGGWRERMVALDAAGRLAFSLSPVQAPAAAIAVTDATDIVELSPAREAWVAELTDRLVARGGVAFLIDYGARTLAGDTLQALRDHREVDPLETPGRADLSTHVDFGRLAAVATAGGARAFGPIAQGAWLARLGAEQRLAALVQARPERATDLAQGVRRLTAAEAMGERFKVMALTTNAATPAGFTAQEAST